MRSALWKLATACGVCGMLTILSLSPASAADNQTINQTVPVPENTVVLNPCTGESVKLTGNLRVVLQLKQSGDTAVITGHISGQGVRGTGVTSGKKYVGSGNGKVSADLPWPPTGFTVTGKFRLISQGSSENLFGVATVQVVVNPNGTFTVTPQSLELECRG